MSPLLVGVLGLLLLLVLILCGIHIGVVLGLTGIAGIILIIGANSALNLIGYLPYDELAIFTWVALPLFILMGEFAHYSGVASEAFSVSYKWLGHLKGGLGQGTTAACALFAACTGSSIAATATMARVALPELRRVGYDKGFATGLIAASGSLASLIPPSGALIIYGMLAHQSLVRLLLAGFLPGILSAIIYMLMIYFLVRAKPGLAPPGEHFSWKEKLRSIPGIGGILIIVLFVIGGMYGGVFTATEAAATGAILTLIMALVKRGLTWRNFIGALQMTSVTTASIFFIILGAFIFAKFLVVSRLGIVAVETITGLGLHPLAILAGITLIYILMGCILDNVSIMAITLPVVIPVIISLGYDPIWFGIFMVKMTEMGLITPPFGLNVYAVKGVVGDEVSLEAIFKNILPFLCMDILTVAVLVAFPQIALFVPEHILG